MTSAFNRFDHERLWFHETWMGIFQGLPLTNCNDHSGCMSQLSPAKDLSSSEPPGCYATTAPVDPFGCGREWALAAANSHAWRCIFDSNVFRWYFSVLHRVFWGYKKRGHFSSTVPVSPNEAYISLTSSDQTSIVFHSFQHPLCSWPISDSSNKSLCQLVHIPIYRYL